MPSIVRRLAPRRAAADGAFDALLRVRPLTMTSSAFACEEARGRVADSGGGAGHEDATPIELEIHPNIMHRFGSSTARSDGVRPTAVVPRSDARFDLLVEADGAVDQRARRQAGQLIESSVNREGPACTREPAGAPADGHVLDDVRDIRDLLEIEVPCPVKVPTSSSPLAATRAMEPVEEDVPRETTTVNVAV